MKRIVLTGGPGSGKTTVLDILRERGYVVGIDVARSIIRERKAAGLSPRPEPRAFSEQILEKEIELYQTATSSPMFFERGITDVAGSLYGAGALDEHTSKLLVDRYRYEFIFLFPPWADIYRTDEERDHTFDHSVRVYESIRDWYPRFGYEVIEVPIDSPQVRAKFILDHSAGA
jgi:predicted ATPase